MPESADKTKLLFVCLGNICRSPAAEEIFRSVCREVGDEDTFEIDSAGLYGGHAGQLPDPRMRAHARLRGLNLSHIARPVTLSDFDRFDIILAMDDANYDDLREMAPTLQDRDKVCRMADWITQYPGHDSIPDPYYGGSQGFENVLDLLQDACHNLHSFLKKQNPKQ